MLAYIALLTEVVLTGAFLFLVFWLQDWTFIPYFKKKQEEKFLKEVEYLLDDLPSGVARASSFRSEKKGS